MTQIMTAGEFATKQIEKGKKDIERYVDELRHDVVNTIEAGAERGWAATTYFPDLANVKLYPEDYDTVIKDLEEAGYVVNITNCPAAGGGSKSIINISWDVLREFHVPPKWGF